MNSRYENCPSYDGVPTYGGPCWTCQDGRGPCPLDLEVRATWTDDEIDDLVHEWHTTEITDPESFDDFMAARLGWTTVDVRRWVVDANYRPGGRAGERSGS